MALWLVRCGWRGEGESVALDKSVVGIGWPNAGRLDAARGRESLRDSLRKGYPDALQATLTDWANQAFWFFNGIQQDDYVALPLRSTPAVAFGRVKSQAIFRADAPPSIRYQRQVAWIQEGIPRDKLRHDLRQALTLARMVSRVEVDNADERVEALLSPSRAVSMGASSRPALSEMMEGDQSAPLDLHELSRDLIRDRIGGKFQGYDLAGLVEEVLKADGYLTNVSRHAAAGVVDILAGQGSLGLGGATLAVRVACPAGSADASTLRQLESVMNTYHAAHGLIVSWGGFTKAALAEERRMFFRIRLWNADDLIAQVLRHYTLLPSEVRTALPLRQIWSLESHEV